MRTDLGSPQTQGQTHLDFSQTTGDGIGMLGWTLQKQCTPENSW